MKAYLKGLSLWEVVENDVDPDTLPSNPTLMRLKKYEEDLTKKPKTFCKTRENSNFLKNDKIVILVKIRNFSRSRMMKRISPLESFREI